jgi:hypothetical protein
MPPCDCVFRISIWAVASVLDIQVRVGAGVNAHLYRFSRSYRVLLYKLIGGNDRMLANFPKMHALIWDTRPVSLRFHRAFTIMCDIH